MVSVLKDFIGTLMSLKIAKPNTETGKRNVSRRAKYLV